MRNPQPTPVEIRWTHPIADHRARVEVIRQAWHGAYATILPPDEIDAVFDGVTQMHGSWTGRRSSPAGTLVAVAADGEVVGVAGLGLMEPGTAEIAALYVTPQWQGRGAGRRLWDAALQVFEHRGMARFEVWTMRDSAARGFYEHMGCTLIGEGDLDIGKRALKAVGYGRAVTPGE